jgi:pyruvate dehydrogenase E1 component beta subunit
MRTIQFREALCEAMSEEMRSDDKIVLMGEEVAEYNGAYKVSQGMLKEFGEERIIDTPIAELGFTGIAVGAAMNGLKPIVEFMTFNFSLVAIDQIINSAAKVYSMSGGQFSCPMVFRGATGTAGQLGAQHSQSFDSWYANCPGLKVVVPSNPADAKGLLKAAIKDPNPVVFMESEQMYGDKGEVPDGEYIIPIGKAKIVKEGSDVTIASYGKLVNLCAKVVAQLEEDGISVELIDLRTIRPIDYETLVESIKKTNRMVFVEESWPLASISSEVAFHLQKKAFDYLDAPIIRVTQRDVPLPYAPNLIDESLPSIQRIKDAVNEVMYK